jgi:hypothetical protein
MGFVQTRRRLRHPTGNVHKRNGTPPTQDFQKAAPLKVFHHQDQVTVIIDPKIVVRHDTGMVDTGYQQGLATKALAQTIVVPPAWSRCLDGDFAVQSNLPAKEYTAEPTFPDGLPQSVSSQYPLANLALHAVLPPPACH